MATIIEKIGKSVDEAFQAALDELGTTADNVEMEVLENSSKGFFGFGAKPAKIRVTLKEIPVPVEEKISEEIPAENPVAEEITTENISDAEENFNREEVINRAKDFLTEVLGVMKVDAKINVIGDESDVVLDLSGKSLGILIGKHGQTLDALQYLLNLTANKYDAPQKLHFILDIENYREKRVEALQKLAKSVAEKVWRTKKDSKLEPMNRQERRIIHTALQDNNKVETHSVGEEPYRYIIVSPKKRGHN